MLAVTLLSSSRNTRRKIFAAHARHVSLRSRLRLSPQRNNRYPTGVSLYKIPCANPRWIFSAGVGAESTSPVLIAI
jgi:hypothetical protein